MANKKRLTLERAQSIIKNQQADLVRAALDLKRSASQLERAHSEHDVLVAIISTLHPSHLAPRIGASANDTGYTWSVCIHAPTGQLTWLLPDAALPLFAHLERHESDWDEHTKFQRLERLKRLHNHRPNVSFPL